MRDRDLKKYDWFMRRTFWSVHCTGCFATFGAWDLDPNKLEAVLQEPCCYCGGVLAGHYEIGVP